MSRTFRLYDTMTRQVKELKTVEPGHLRFYSCGPTVYSYAHIGNFRTFLTADLVIRTAQALGWRVTYVSNITDVGHLTEDSFADSEGEDKMAKALKSKDGAQFQNVWELAEFYEDAFTADWQTLNLISPTVRPKATQHMREQILAVEDLISKGLAYETPTGVYYSVGSFPTYGKLSGNTAQDDLLVGAREVVLDDNKKDPRDFALWKKDEKHLMQWHSPWGWGFPGWHLECSCMSRSYLGDTIDLHGGGEDLVFPHHECEIAQSEGLTGKPFSNHWLHVKFLQVDGEKMSKSKGNYYTVRDLTEGKRAHPLALRFALISTPYGKSANFTLQTLADATRHIERFGEAEKRIEAALGKPAVEIEGEANPEFQRIYEEALDAMCDNLNTSVAIAKALEGIKAILRESQLSQQDALGAAWFLNRINALLGFVRSDYGAGQQDEAPQADPDSARIDGLVNERIQAKKDKNFARADEIRKQLEAEGIELRDTPTGTEWRRKAGV